MLSATVIVCHPALLYAVLPLDSTVCVNGIELSMSRHGIGC